jgi:hypothetical protein
MIGSAAVNGVKTSPLIDKPSVLASFRDLEGSGPSMTVPATPSQSRRKADSVACASARVSNSRSIATKLASSRAAGISRVD